MNSRTFLIDESTNKVMTIEQNLDYGYAGEVWDGSLVFIYFMLKNKDKLRDTFHNKTVLDLGAGTGSCGILSSIFEPKNVVITDIQKAVELIDRNIKSNIELVANAGKVEALALDWKDADQIASLKEKFDYFDCILCCEVVWNPLLFEALINTLTSFFQKGKSKIIFAYTFRKAEEKLFFKQLQERLQVNLKTYQKQDYDTDYYSEDIMILEFY